MLTLQFKTLRTFALSPIELSFPIVELAEVYME